MLQYLSFGLIFSRYGITQNAYLALGKPQYITLISLLKLVSLFGVVPLLYLEFGLPGALLGISTHMLLPTLCMQFLNSKHELNNWRFEFLVFAAWLFGWLLGHGFSGVADSLFSLLASFTLRVRS
jgi:hypothetical protein